MKFNFRNVLEKIIMDSEKPKFQKTILQKVDILHCSACGADHYGEEVKPLETPFIEGYNYFIKCPFKNSPVYIKFFNH